MGVMFTRETSATRGSLAQRLRRWFAVRDGEPVDDLGLPWRFHYHLVAFSALTMSVVPFVLSYTDQGRDLAEAGSREMCVIGLVFPALYLWLARRWRYAYKRGFFNTVIAFGTFVLAGSAYLNTTSITEPMMISVILAPIGAAYYLPARQAILQVTAVVLTVGLMFLVLDTPHAGLRSTFMAIVIVAIGWLLIAIKRHLAEVVTANRELAERDPLTGAANLRRFEQRADEEIARHVRGSGSFHLIAVDLDDFKQTNDRFSHTLGDQVLHDSAAAMADCLSPADLLVRRGGDEFLVLAVDEAGRDIGQLQRSMRESVAAARRQICPAVIPTATTAAVEHRVGESIADLVSRADDALHAVKISAPSTRRGTASAEDVARLTEPHLAVVSERRLATLHDARKETRLASARDSLRIAWTVSAGVAGAFAIASLAFAFAGSASVEPTWQVLTLSAISLLVMVPGFALLGRDPNQSSFKVTLLGAVSLAVITAGVMTAGEAATASVEMFLVPIFVVAAVMPPRISVPYGFMCMGLYLAVLTGTGYEMVALRYADSVVNVGVAATVVGFMRAGTVAAARQHRELASVDSLTGLPNLRRLRSRLDDELRRAESGGTPFGLIMLDLDEFKSVNDVYSHTLGDRVLVSVAEAIDRATRHADMTARRGGDEFAVVVIDGDEGSMPATVRRVGEGILEARAKACSMVSPTASIGWVVSRGGETVDELLARVDAELHERKVESHVLRGVHEDLSATASA